MAISIHTNLMAGNAARTLGSHYNRLSKSVQRLSSGLRINSAADDAAGLAIRELMRADVSTLNQGIRNANDAISMIQVADGALAVIDEKLIRMKELAEQAATGTYNSTQRLIISSEYQAMAAEIDRIANATDFNGIKLLDGSLSGTHNGKGMRATGALKIHFGTANDSAEDYYYVSIGDCTAAALGVGAGATQVVPGVEYVPIETTGQVQLTYKQENLYYQYEDPDTGGTYYTDGKVWFSDINNPGGTMLDEKVETHAQIIKRLIPNAERDYADFNYDILIDPVTNKEYYKRLNTGSNQIITSNAFDPLSKLDETNASDKLVLDRLVDAGRRFSARVFWDVYLNPDGTKYYTCNGGQSFTLSKLQPNNSALDASKPEDKAIIDTLKPSIIKQTVQNPEIRILFNKYTDPVTGNTYYSRDGATFYFSINSSPLTPLDPRWEQDIIDRLVPKMKEDKLRFSYDIYTHPDTGQKYYTLADFYSGADYGKVFFTDISKSDPDVVLDASSAADAAEIARLLGTQEKAWSNISCKVYEDLANGNKKYYSMDNGKTFFDDLADHQGSVLDASAPGYGALIANFNKIDATATLSLEVDVYRNPSKPGSVYYTMDGGKTFFLNKDHPEFLPVSPSEAANLIPRCESKLGQYQARQMLDPVTGLNWYWRPVDAAPDRIYDSRWNRYLDKNDPDDLAIMQRLEEIWDTSIRSERTPFPDLYYVYEDKTTNITYYSPDEGKTFTSNPLNPYLERDLLNPANPAHKAIIDRLEAKTITGIKTEFVPKPGAVGSIPADGATISTQEAAQKALVAIDNAIVSKDKIRAHLGALQNRLENTVTNLSIQAENLQASESRISDTDVATEMTAFVRNQILTESATAMLSQANSFPHMLMNLLQG